jgi:hypothetical protein
LPELGQSLPSLRITDFVSEVERVIGDVRHFLCVVGSAERLESGWVRAERNMFLNEMWSGRKQHGNLLTVNFGDLQPSQLPLPLRSYHIVPLHPMEAILDFLPFEEGKTEPLTGASTVPGNSPMPGPPAGAPGLELQAAEHLEWHKLHQFPRGPLVPDTLITNRLVRAFARRFESVQAINGAVREANDIRQAADPEASPDRICMQPFELPTPGHGIGAWEYWQSAWQLASIKGPRMVGALLLLVEPVEVDAATNTDVMRLIEYMRKM